MRTCNLPLTGRYTDGTIAGILARGRGRTAQPDQDAADVAYPVRRFMLSASMTAAHVSGTSELLRLGRQGAEGLASLREADDQGARMGYRMHRRN